MSLRTFFTWSFLFSTIPDGEGHSTLYVQNDHSKDRLLGGHISLKVPDSMSAEQTEFDLPDLDPGQKVELTTITQLEDGLFKSKKIKAKCSGKVEGDDVDNETLSVDVRF